METPGEIQQNVTPSNEPTPQCWSKTSVEGHRQFLPNEAGRIGHGLVRIHNVVDTSWIRVLPTLLNVTSTTVLVD